MFWSKHIRHVEFSTLERIHSCLPALAKHRFPHSPTHVFVFPKMLIDIKKYRIGILKTSEDVSSFIYPCSVLSWFHIQKRLFLQFVMQNNKWSQILKGKFHKRIVSPLHVAHVVDGGAANIRGGNVSPQQVLCRTSKAVSLMESLTACSPSVRKMQGSTNKMSPLPGSAPWQKCYKLGVTTRIITFLVGDPYKTSFTTVTVRGSYPSYKIVPRSHWLCHALNSRI